MDSLPTGPKYHPTLGSSAEEKVVQLKHGLVLALFLQQGPFWIAVQNVRSEWDITVRRVLPSKGDRGTYRPIEQEPPGKWTKERLEFNDRWDDALRSLRDRFVSNRLRRSLGHEFFGACVMCDPPQDCLLEFSKFGAVYPSVFWPVVDCEEEKIDLPKLQSMIAPPTERVFKESYEEGEPFMEYRIVVEEDTTSQDIDNAFRAIKAAADIKNRGGRKRMDKLVALQCAILYDDHNGVDPEDNRYKLWTYEKLAAYLKHLGVKNKRSAEEHVKYGRELRKANKN